MLVDHRHSGFGTIDGVLVLVVKVVRGYWWCIGVGSKGRLLVLVV